ncbi:MAG TPA: sterol desaturase family protein [Burkholderiaceae bacterium]|jgi:sterol desaturase/sphingolipid hydroxylase (fatty acid hydroxylase superfamily)|nr:sterol desaturase family protein [Burkholderiaceae bacterium]
MVRHGLFAGAPLVPRFAGVAALALFALVIAEALLRRYVWRRPTDLRGVAASLADAFVRRGADLLGLGALAPLPVLAQAHRLATIRMDSVAAWLGLYLLVEFVYYWHHRLTHRVRWFWATHSVHHSSNELTLAAAVRLGWTGRLGGAAAFFASLIWIGFPPQAVFGLVAAGLLWQFWLHADWLPRLGPLEWVLNTPTHHRVHHASNPEYLDCNYGSSLIVFDRLFGTFVALRPDIEIRYGLTKPVLSHNPIRIAFNEWLALGREFRAARGARARLRVLFGPP